MSTSSKTALEMAESSNWSALHHAVSDCAERAQEKDDFGMMPLHWACTDRNVPLRVILTLIEAFPDAVMSKNKGGLFPLHIAVKARAHLDVLCALVEAGDEAVCVETPAGETPAEMAQLLGLPRAVVQYLNEFEAKLRDQGKVPQRRSKVQLDPRSSRLGFPEAPPASNYMNLLRSQSNTTVMLPPRWKLDKKCKICYIKFSYFKSRHHCRNCGESVCSTHSNRKLPLQHLGLVRPQRVCILCYDELRENGKPSAVVNLFANHAVERSQSSDSFRRNGSGIGANGINPLVPSSSLSASFLQAREKERAEFEEDEFFQIEDDEEEVDGKRPRSHTELVKNKDAKRYSQMQNQVKELESHVRELMETKDKIQNALMESNRQIKQVLKEQMRSEMQATELEKTTNLDLNHHIPEDKDEEDNDEEESKGFPSFLPVNEAPLDVAATCNMLGVALYERGDYSGAILEFRKSVALNGNDPEVWHNLARALHAADETTDAELSIRKALELRPDNYASLSLLGKILHTKGEHDHAIQTFREALGLVHTGDDSDEEVDIGSTTVGW